MKTTTLIALYNVVKSTLPNLWDKQTGLLSGFVSTAVFAFSYMLTDPSKKDSERIEEASKSELEFKNATRPSAMLKINTLLNKVAERLGLNSSSTGVEVIPNF